MSLHSRLGLLQGFEHLHPHLLDGTGLAAADGGKQMTNPVQVTKFESQSHDSPDETRTPDKTRVEVNRMEGFTIARIT